MKRAKRLFFLILFAACSIIFLEGTYRLFRYVKHGHVKFVFLDTAGALCNHDIYGFSLTPGFDSRQLPKQMRFSQEGRGYHLDKVIKINSRGFRGDEFSAVKEENVYRILILGGSTTYCAGDNDQTWPAYLEQALNNKVSEGRHFEVINCGVPNWQSAHSLLQFKNEGVHLQPDLIILHTGWNDLLKGSNKKIGNGLSYKYGLKACPNQIKNIKADISEALKPSFIERNFVLYQQIKIRIINKHVKNPFDLLEKAIDKNDPIHDRWLETWRRNVFQIVDIAKNNGIKVILVDYPALARTGAEPNEKSLTYQQTRIESERYYNFWARAKNLLSEYIHNMAEEKKVPVVEASRLFDKYSGKERLHLFTDEIHLTQEGDLALANCVADEIEKLKEEDRVLPFFINDNRSEINASR